MKLSPLFALLIGIMPLLSACNKPSPQEPAGQPKPKISSAPSELLVPQFTNQTSRAGIRFRHDNGSSGRFYYPEIVGPGCGLFDYDNDGWLDVYLVQGAPLPGWRGKASLTNKLYRNNHDGTFRDVTEKAGVGGIINGKKTYSIGCATGDFDNDGDEDLLVTNFGSCILYRNNGNGTFSDVTRRAGIKGEGFWTSAVFFDYNRDGRLDLFICSYIKYKPGADVACSANARQPDYCPPGYFPPSQSVLYRNNGNGTFTDVTRAAGITSDYNKALGVVAADFNNDGWEDLYVTCDLTPNLLYINKGNGSFEDEAIEQGVALSEMGQPLASMGVDSRDYDGNLRPDIVVTNYWLEGANLYRNLDGQMFTENSQNAGLGAPTLKKVGWGTALRDFNNDTFLDCFIANGHVLMFPHLSTPDAELKQSDQLFLNVGNGKFRDVSAQAGPWFREKHVTRGAAFGDIDNDGDIDVLVAHNNDEPGLLINNGGNRKHWLAVKLIGRTSNRSGIGAKVFVTLGDKTIYEEIHSTYSFASTNDLRAHFGLGDAEHIDMLKIKWPSRQVDMLRHVKANQIITVTEGQSQSTN